MILEIKTVARPGRGRRGFWNAFPKIEVEREASERNTWPASSLRIINFQPDPGFICIREIQRHIHSVYSLDKLLLPALQQFALSEYVELLESRTRSRDSCSVTFRISSDRESCCEGSLKCSLILSLFLCCVFITCFFFVLLK